MILIYTFEQMRDKYSKPLKNKHRIICTVATTACVFVACTIAPAMSACGVLKEQQLTEVHSYTATVPANGETASETQTFETRLDETVFGAQYAEAIQNAMDAQAYSKALAYDVQVQTAYAEEQERIADAKRFYIPEITLDYEAEKMYVPYETQKYIWDMCNELNLDYFLVMGIIARESRFQLDIVSCTAGVYYYGGMQVSGEFYYDMIEEVGGNPEGMTPNNVYDNLWLGMHLLAYCIEETGSEQAGVMAYGTGLGGYYDSVANGIYTCSDVEKAYKFRKLLLQNERYNPETDGVLTYDT